MVKRSTALIKLLSCLVLLPCVVVACGPAQDDDDDDEYVVVIGSPDSSNPDEQGDPGSGSQQPGEVGEQGEEMPQGESIDPEFRRYFDGRTKLAVLDCGCSERDPEVWSPIMTKEQCVDNWQRHLGDQQSISCQNRLVQELPTVKSYVQCLADADQALMDSWGGQCPESSKIQGDMVADWNLAKFDCQVKWPGERVAFEECADHVVQDFSQVTKSAWVSFSYADPRGGSFLTLDNESEQSLKGYGGWSYYLAIRANGTFAEYSQMRRSTYIDEYSDWGVWTLADQGSRVLMSADCEKFFPTRFFIGFQRLFLGHYTFRPYPMESLPPFVELDRTVDELCQ